MVDHSAAVDHSGVVDRRVAEEPEVDRSAAADRRVAEATEADRSAEADRYEVVDRNGAADRFAVVAHFAQVDRCAADRFAEVDHFAVAVRKLAARPSAQESPLQARLAVTPDPAEVLTPRFVRALLAAIQCQPGQTLLALPERQQGHALLWMEPGWAVCLAQLPEEVVQLASAFPSPVWCRRVAWVRQPEHVHRSLRLRPGRHAFPEMGARPRLSPVSLRWRRLQGL